MTTTMATTKKFCLGRKCRKWQTSSADGNHNLFKQEPQPEVQDEMHAWGSQQAIRRAPHVGRLGGNCMLPGGRTLNGCHAGNRVRLLQRSRRFSFEVVAARTIPAAHFGFQRSGMEWFGTCLEAFEPFWASLIFGLESRSLGECSDRPRSKENGRKRAVLCVVVCFCGRCIVLSKGLLARGLVKSS
jgi:hypothetical protein